jgi:hypothetical protein
VYGQMQDYSCVAASCRMVAGEGPEAYWRTAVNTVDDAGGAGGATLQDAASALTDAGHPSVYRAGLSVDDLAGSGGPSIVSGNGHALVVDRVSGGQVFIRDPLPGGAGSSYTVSVADFTEWWSGRAVVPGG